MKEILFRGFHPCDGPETIVVDGEKVKGEWVEGYLWSKRTIGVTSPCGNLDEVVVLTSTVGQYTGLTDKNGKRIFEGDILQTETDYFGNHKINKEPVLWNDDIENDSFGEPFTSWYIIHGGNWEIIGTVFDEEAQHDN